MLTLKTTDDLQSLIDDDIPESLTLEYKAAPSLAKNDNAVNELCKDVSAFANSAGGQIVYGIEEKGHKPLKIDAGSEMSREWIEQVINSNIQPRLRGLIINPIALSNANHAYVLTIPASTTAHQARDKKYYRRFNFESVAMHDYEIRDVMKRSTTAEPFITLTFDEGSKTTSAGFARQLSIITPVRLHVLIGNRSVEPALYSLVEIDIDAQLQINDQAGFQSGTNILTSKNHPLKPMTRRVTIPDQLPVFKEIQFQVGDRPISFSFEVMTPSDEYLVRTKVLTPGFSAIEDWIIHRYGTKLTLEGPLGPIHAL